MTMAHVGAFTTPIDIPDWIMSWPTYANQPTGLNICCVTCGAERCRPWDANKVERFSFIRELMADLLHARDCKRKLEQVCDEAVNA